jgi:hypothetical protein
MCAAAFALWAHSLMELPQIKSSLFRKIIFIQLETSTSVSRETFWTLKMTK